MSEELRPLVDDDGIADVLRRDLANARAADAGYDVAAGVARFEAAIAAGPLADAGTPAEAAAVAKATKPWWIVGGGGVVAAAALAAWSLGRDPEVAPREAPVVDARSVEEAPPRSAAPQPTPPQPTTVPEEPRVATPVPAAPSKRAAAKAAAAPASSDPPSDEGDALTREMAATAEARRALASDPKRALELVAAADREFKGGLYAEDREGIAVLALAKLGRSADARARGEAYLAAHPKGSYADRIRELLAPEP